MADRELNDPDRPVLIKKLYSLLKDEVPTPTPALPVAFLWFCDIENLRGAYIFCHPHSIYMPPFWKYLKIFWPEETVNAWEKEVTELGDEDKLENLIMLDSSVNAAWDACLCALEPGEVSEDRTQMPITFYWLKQNTLGVEVDENQIDKKPEFPSNLPSGLHEVKFFDQRYDLPIKSGQEIILTTFDKDKFPLPSKTLLTMRWHLHRIVAITAAVDVDEEEGEEGEEVEEGGEGGEGRGEGRGEGKGEEQVSNYPPLHSI